MLLYTNRGNVTKFSNGALTGHLSYKLEDKLRARFPKLADWSVTLTNVHHALPTMWDDSGPGDRFVPIRFGRKFYIKPAV